MFYLLGIRVIPNIYLYFTNLQRLPEFAGYKARRIPGQPGPKSCTLIPKGRPRDLESLAADIKNITVRRQARMNDESLAEKLASVQIVIHPPEVEC